MKFELVDVTSDYSDRKPLNPYEDWEAITRPAWQSDDKDVLYQPVYVEFTKWSGSSKSEVEEFIDLLASESKELTPAIMVPEDTLEILKSLGGAMQKKTSPERFLRFFVFRPETLSYSTKLDDHRPNALPYKVIHVGAAIPKAVASGIQAGTEISDRGFRTAMHAAPASGKRPPVLTGIVDGIMGFANERFRESEYVSRVKHFWGQAVTRKENQNLVIGVTLTDKEINDALSRSFDESSVYDQLASAIIIPRGAEKFYDPGYRRPFGFRGTHGTHVMDIAAGFPCGDPKGARRPIVAVQLPELATIETWGARLDLYILLAVHRMIRWADGHPDGPAPLVINISYGFSAGHKDGNGFLEKEIARLIQLRNADPSGAPTYVVVPAGNFFRDQTHAEASIDKGEEIAFEWVLQPADRSVSFLEIWLDRLESSELHLSSPDGADISLAISPGTTVHRIKRDDLPVVSFYRDTFGHRTRVIIATLPTLNDEEKGKPRWVTPGAYKIRVRNTGPRSITAYCDVQRDDTPLQFPAYGRQSYLDSEDVDEFDAPTQSWTRPYRNSRSIVRERTFSALATVDSNDVLVVGGAMDRDNWTGSALYASSGPSHDARKAPDLSAVCEETRTHWGVLASGFFSGSAVAYGGTSVSAPAVTRRLVDLLDAGTSSKDILQGLLEGGRPYDNLHPRLGHGVVRHSPLPGRPPRRAEGI